MTESFSTLSPRMKKRYAAETRFKWYGRFAIAFALGFLAIMVLSIATSAFPALKQTQIELAIELPEDAFDLNDLSGANYGKLVKDALKDRFPEVKKRKERRKLYGLVSSDAEYALRTSVEADPSLVGTTHTLWVIASDDIDQLQKGKIDISLPEKSRILTDTQVSWVKSLEETDQIDTSFSLDFFIKGDSREPELAGILSALVGSALTLLVCFLISFPVGILAAIYLQEYAKKNRWSEFLEVNINNLAAVPSIVFGLLGLALILNIWNSFAKELMVPEFLPFIGGAVFSLEIPRSSPLIGGIVLSLMTLPTIIIASRAALRAVPPSIREAALGVGASRTQTTFHHVAPLALPGMLTGAIIGMARALGDTAPLLMIGMVAFIVDVPKSILEPATALPVQVFLWADSPETAFLERTTAAIMVLLLFLVLMNLTAIVLRRKFERRF